MINTPYFKDGFTYQTGVGGASIASTISLGKMVQGTHALQHGKAKGHHDAGVNGFHAEAFAQKQKSKYQKGHVHNGGEVTGGPARHGADNGGKTGNASECKVIGKFKEIYPHYHEHNTSGYQRILS